MGNKCTDTSTSTNTITNTSTNTNIQTQIQTQAQTQIQTQTQTQIYTQTPLNITCEREVQTSLRRRIVRESHLEQEHVNRASTRLTMLTVNQKCQQC